MSAEYIIISDATGNFTKSQCEQYGIEAVPVTVCIGGREFKHYCDAREMSFEEFYARLRAGEETSTSAPSPGDFESVARPALESGKGVLIITFSSGLACTNDNANIAAGQLREDFPGCEIEVVDSLCADSGEAMLVVNAAINRQNGMSLSDNARWVENNRQNICHWFMVDDLNHLRRGGRLSAASAVIGSVLGIKPILHVDEEGRLVNTGTARGRKKAIDTILEKAASSAIDPEKQTMFISHADCESDALFFAQEVKKRLGAPEVLIGFTGPAASAHSGPGTLAFFFIGTQR